MPDAASAARALRKADHFSARLDHDTRLHSPAGDGFAQLRGDMGNGRDHELDRPDARGNALDRVAENAGKTPDLVRPAARQGQNKRRIGQPAPRLIGIWAQFADALDQRMADIAARRPAELDMDGRLERQDRQHLVDISAHGARASGPPCPNRRRDVVEDRNRRREPAHPAGDPMREVRAVDDDERVRARGDDGLRGFADAPKNLRQPLRDRGKPDDRQLVDRKWAGNAGSRHGVAADAGKLHRAGFAA